MTPSGTAVPPITTPPADSPMPVRTRQPASVGGCVDSGQILTPGSAQTASAKKGAAKGKAKKRAAKDTGPADAAESVGAVGVDQAAGAWPAGLSEQDEDQPGVQGAWPSGISER